MRILIDFLTGFLQNVFKIENDCKERPKYGAFRINYFMHWLTQLWFAILILGDKQVTVPL